MYFSKGKNVCWEGLLLSICRPHSPGVFVFLNLIHQRTHPYDDLRSYRLFPFHPLSPQRPGGVPLLLAASHRSGRNGCRGGTAPHRWIGRFLPHSANLTLSILRSLSTRWKVTPAAWDYNRTSIKPVPLHKKRFTGAVCLQDP
jgi:hypothetical protein